MVFYKPLTIEYFLHPRLFDCTVSKTELKTLNMTVVLEQPTTSTFVCASTLDYFTSVIYVNLALGNLDINFS